MAKYELGTLYQTTSSSPSRPKAKGEKPIVPSDTTKMQSNTKNTGNLSGQPMAKLSKKVLPPTANPDGKDSRS